MPAGLAGLAPAIGAPPGDGADLPAIHLPAIHLPAGPRRAAPADGGDRPRRLLLDDPADVAAAAAALADGAVVGHGFANFYALTTRPDPAAVRTVNLLKGRPPHQVASITTTPLRIPLVYDWSRLPAQLGAGEVLAVMDALLALGPVGFRGPAASAVPDHLTQLEGRVRTAQVIAPGHACPSNDFLARALTAAGTDVLAITSANRSRHRSGAAEEPAHWRAAGLRADFGADRRLVLLEHPDENAAVAAYPAFAPMSTSILAFHTVLPARAGRRWRLILERHGSMPAELLREVVGDLGFDLAVGPQAQRRLSQRTYPRARTRQR